ncbi:MAG: histone deacetylase [Gemmatimonadales bacterium]|nr:MAG: histone deacetylase [Gemmatimonadales bacterium]
MRTLPWIWSPAYEVDIGLHVYPTTKYRRIRDLLVAEGSLREADFRAPAPVSREVLAVAHDAAWIDRVLTGGLTPSQERLLELPFTPQLRDAFVLCCGGTLEAGRLALEHGTSVHLGGGFHHAFRGHGEGFCLLNDVAVAAAALCAEGSASRVAIVDLDVHHGNGTASIFQGDPDVFTFSMHQAWNYPARKPAGDLDIPLPDGTPDAAYLDLLETHLPTVLAHDPDLVLYLAGVDPFEDDQLGGLSLTPEGLRARDRLVFEAAGRARIPVAIVLAGGYARREEVTVDLHCNTIREAAAAHAALP